MNFQGANWLSPNIWLSSLLPITTPVLTDFIPPRVLERPRYSIVHNIKSHPLGWDHRIAHLLVCRSLLHVGVQQQPGGASAVPVGFKKKREIIIFIWYYNIIINTMVLWYNIIIWFEVTCTTWNPRLISTAFNLTTSILLRTHFELW